MITSNRQREMVSIIIGDSYNILLILDGNTTGKATEVKFHVWVLSLDSIDEGSMTYAADVFMSQSWHDHRLIIPDFATNTTENYRLLPLSWLNRMWRPDSFFKNAKQVVFQEMTIPNHYIWLYSDKKILYMTK
jgi:hypothetical protein